MIQRLLLSTLVPLLACGCSLFGKSIEPAWAEADVDAPSERTLWETALLAIDKAGYPIGIGRDPANRRIETGWIKDLHPFTKKGFRQRAIVEYEPVERRLFHFKVRVERELNKSPRGLDPLYAEWTPDEDNFQQAEQILQFVKSFLGESLPTDED